MVINGTPRCACAAAIGAAQSSQGESVPEQPACPPSIVGHTTVRQISRVLLLAIVISGAAMASVSRPAMAAVTDDPSCDAGEFCAWPEERYHGVSRRLTIETANPGECVPLPDALAGRSFVNRLREQVTVYQGETCSTEADFSTYPGGGTYVPVAPFVVRAIQVWQ
jgi:hypothetical protein